MDTLRMVLVLLAGVALAAMSTWPLWTLVLIARGVLCVLGVWLVCDALGALVAKAMRARDERP